MTDEKTKISLGLPWLAIAIGGLSGWIVGGTIEGLLVGCLLGIVVSVSTYLGFIPFVGPFVYHLVVNTLFGAVGMNLSILYWYGMIFAIIFTCITSFIVIIIIGAIIVSS